MIAPPRSTILPAGRRRPMRRSRATCRNPAFSSRSRRIRHRVVGRRAGGEEGHQVVGVAAIEAGGVGHGFSIRSRTPHSPCACIVTPLPSGQDFRIRDGKALWSGGFRDPADVPGVRAARSWRPVRPRTGHDEARLSGGREAGTISLNGQSERCLRTAAAAGPRNALLEGGLVELHQRAGRRTRPAALDGDTRQHVAREELRRGDLARCRRACPSPRRRPASRRPRPRPCSRR